MIPPVTVGVIGATGTIGHTVIQGLLSSKLENDFEITTFTRQSSLNSPENQKLRDAGVITVGYDLSQPQTTLVNNLKGICVLISCMNVKKLDLQIPWIEAAKLAGVKRFIPSEWVSPMPPGICDVKDTKLEVLAAIHRARLPYTIIDIGCWFSVFVPQVPSGRSDHAHWDAIDHRIVGDGNQKFALIDESDIGKYVARIITDPRTINKHIFVYNEILSMNEIWNTMGAVSGEEPPRTYVSVEELQDIIAKYPQILAQGQESVDDPKPSQADMNYNLAQLQISWCARGDNTPEYAEYLGYLNFWELFPDFPKGKTLETYFRQVVKEGGK